MSNLFHEEGEPATGKKVMLATPCYGTPSASYVFSIARSREELHKAGIQSAYLLLQGMCHVDDARNAIVRHFLASDCTDLMFLDADNDWEPKDLVQLCRRELDIVGGVYPYRRDGSEEMPVRLKEGSTKAIDGLLEVDGLPTGFMKIKRSVLERMAADAPKFFDKLEETALIFDRPTPGEDKTRWGGDIAFCNRWLSMGGRIFADQEIRLGHTGTIVVRDSLASHLRRISGATLAHVIPRVRAGIETENDYNEAFKYAGNNYAADAGVLATVTRIARNCRGPIIETGSGLSSVFMGAVSDSQVYSLEHVDHYAAQTVAWCEEAGVSNVGVCCAPLKDFWYDLDKFDLPAKFTLGFCDGPPRMYGTRMKFFEALAPRCAAILVDDIKSDHKYLRAVHEWAQAHSMNVTILGRAALLAKESVLRKAA
jgi:predicted O-methyltransferase YrrM